MIATERLSADLPPPSWPAEEERYAYVRRLVERVASPPADLVELGAAPGVQSIALARAGYRVTAVDLGEASDEWAGAPEGTMKSALARAGITLVRWDLERTPYPLPDEAFDVALLTEVLEHLREYPIRALLETRRILRSGGLLLLTTPNAARLPNRLRAVTGRSVYSPLDDWIGGLPFARHAREYTAAELEELLRRAGFEIELFEARHFHLHSGRQGVVAGAAKRALDLAGRIRPSFGSGLVVVARRPP